jgi:PAS domain S-box-containing protein
MSEPLKILVIEDSEADFLLLTNHLRQQGVDAECRRASTPDETRAALADGGWDIVLSDYNLPGIDIRGVLDELQARHPDLPVILISGSIGEERAVEMLRRGVCDFILKDNLARLAPAIQRSRQEVTQRRARQEAEAALRESRVAALNMMEDAVEARRQAERVALDLQQEMVERRRAGDALRESEARFQRMTACIDDVLYGVDGAAGEFQYVSPAFERLFGYTADDIVRKGGREAFLAAVIQDGMFEAQRQVFRSLSAADATPQRSEAWWRCKNGELRCIEDRWIPVFEDGKLTTTFGVLRDITERRRAQVALERSEERYRRLFEGMSDSIYVLKLDESATPGAFVEVNGAVCRQLGYTREEMLAKSPFDIDPGLTLDRGRHLGDLIRQGQVTVFETIHRAKDGHIIPVEIRAHTFDLSGETMVLCIARDLSERQRLEAQVRQAQKMEAVGQLAGGVAHDFNNILTTVLLQVELLQDNPTLDAETREGLRELKEQARRAAALTRQLLLFSRKSAIELAPLDLTEVAGNLLKMLRRTLGEHIELRFHGKSALPRIKADAGMMEQVLMNLAVNARDAMPDGGQITIATEVADLGEADPPGHPEARPGRFVLLTVTDTGCGMDAATLHRIFEPFFTTKDVGKGTGLGLATVYGIVQQHMGWVEVDSAVGRGTTFRVYLPAIEGDTGDLPPGDGAATAAPGGAETILLVEDETDVRNVTAAYLRSRGYRVLEAATGRQALAQWARHKGDIRLVFSDMVMPEGMTGLDLALELREEMPSLRIIISSGYSPDLARLDVLRARGLVFLPKPSPPFELAQAVRRCLDGPPPT